MTPPSRRICPLGPYISNLIFRMCGIYIPGGPVLANSRRSSTAGVEPTTARVLPKLVSCKALASVAKAPNEKKYVRSFLG